MVEAVRSVGLGIARVDEELRLVVSQRDHDGAALGCRAHLQRAREVDDVESGRSLIDEIAYDDEGDRTRRPLHAVWRWRDSVDDPVAREERGEAVVSAMDVADRID